MIFYAMILNVYVIYHLENKSHCTYLCVFNYLVVYIFYFPKYIVKSLSKTLYLATKYNDPWEKGYKVSPKIALLLFLKSFQVAAEGSEQLIIKKEDSYCCLGHFFTI